MHPSFTRLGAGLGAVALVLAAPHAEAAGPGLGNLTFTDAELYKPIAYFDATNGALRGTNVPLFINGYLLLHYAPDGGRAGTGLAVYDISNPRSPVFLKSVESAETAVLRENHAMPLARIGGRDYFVSQAVAGIQIWDVTDPLMPTFTSALTLPGIAGGDYVDAAWWTSWQAQYVFVGGLNHGVFVVDARDPAQPVLVTQVEQSKLNFLAGPVFAMGDRLVVTNTNGIVASWYAIVDITNPAEPFVLDAQKFGLGLQNNYAAFALGERIYGIGRFNNCQIVSTDDDTLTLLSDTPGMGQGSYGSVQDNILHYGGKTEYRKVDISDEVNPVTLNTVVLPVSDVDHGQAFALGNLVYIGNDHASGSALAVHQTAPDTTPPAVVWAFPAHGQTQVAAGNRIGISFSDYLDFASVGPTSIVITDGAGTAVDGIYSYWANTVSFGPHAPWAPNTTYQIAVKAGGVRDVAGNAVASDVILYFSTGPDIAGGVGGAGGFAGAGATGGGGSGANAGTGQGGGAGLATAEPDEESGCACRSAAPERSTHFGFMLALALLLSACKLRRTTRVVRGAAHEPPR